MPKHFVVTEIAESGHWMIYAVEHTIEAAREKAKERLEDYLKAYEMEEDYEAGEVVPPEIGDGEHHGEAWAMVEIAGRDAEMGPSYFVIDEVE